MFKKTVYIKEFVFLSIIVISLGITVNDANADPRITQTGIIGYLNDTSTIIGGDMFGYDVEVIGDIDGNGGVDYAVVNYGCPNQISSSGSATQCDANFDSVASLDRWLNPYIFGSVSIIMMNSDGSYGSNLRITMDDDPTTGIGLPTRDKGDGIGCLDNPFLSGSVIDARDDFHPEHIAFLGDLNGKPTVAIGVAEFDYTLNEDGTHRVELSDGDWTSGANNGGILLAALNTDGTVYSCTTIAEGQHGFTNPESFYSTNEGRNAYFGWPLFTADINQDGTTDIIAGQDHRASDTQYLTCEEAGIVRGTTDYGDPIIQGLNDGGQENNAFANTQDTFDPDFGAVFYNATDGTYFCIHERISQDEVDAIVADATDGTKLIDIDDIDIYNNKDDIIDTNLGYDALIWEPYTALTDLVVVFMNNDGTILDTALIEGPSMGHNVRHHEWFETAATIDKKGKFIIGAASGNSGQKDFISIVNVDTNAVVTDYTVLHDQYLGYISPYMSDWCRDDDCGSMGRDLAYAGDVNADGINDVFIGAEQDEGAYPLDKDGNQGSVFLTYLNDDDTIQDMHMYRETIASGKYNFGHGITILDEVVDQEFTFIVGAHEWQNFDGDGGATIPKKSGALLFYHVNTNESPKFEVKNTLGQPKSVDYTINLPTSDIYTEGVIQNIVDESYPGSVSVTIDSSAGPVDSNSLVTGIFTVTYTVSDVEPLTTIITETIIVTDDQIPTIAVTDMFSTAQTSDFTTALTFGDVYNEGIIASTPHTDTIAYLDEDGLPFASFMGDGTHITSFDGIDLSTGTYYVKYSVTDFDPTPNITVEIIETVTVNPYYGISSASASSGTSDSNGCDDCIDPTFYYSQNKFIVKDGFRYNGYSTNVTASHTETDPLVTITNQKNYMILKAYDNFGTDAIKWIDVGFGHAGKKVSFDSAEVRIEIKISNNEVVEQFIFPKEQNLIDFDNATSNIVRCGYMPANCLEITIPHVFRDYLIDKPIIFRAEDESGNIKTHTINHGIELQGEPLDGYPTDRIFIQKYLGNPSSEWVDIKRIDRSNGIWISEDGLEFKHSGGGFQRITPLGFDNTLID